MKKIKFKILYGLSLIAFLVGGIMFGYHRENRNPLFTANILDYAIRFNVDEMENYAITASTKYEYRFLYPNIILPSLISLCISSIYYTSLLHL